MHFMGCLVGLMCASGSGAPYLPFAGSLGGAFAAARSNTNTTHSTWDRLERLELSPLTVGLNVLVDIHRRSWPEE
jgi:hypothetical protein